MRLVRILTKSDEKRAEMVREASDETTQAGGVSDPLTNTKNHGVNRVRKQAENDRSSDFVAVDNETN